MRSNALENLGYLVKSLSGDSSSSRKTDSSGLVELITDLLKDQSMHVRNTLVELVTHHRHIFPKAFQKDQIPEIIVNMLKDESVKVKLTAIKSMTELMEIFDPEVYKEKILPEMTKLVTDKNWKIRNAILEQEVETLKRCDHLDQLWKELVELIMSLRDDHVNCIRENLIKNILEIYSHESSGSFNSQIRDLLDTQIRDLCVHWS